MSWLLIIMLIFLGVAFLLLEILVIPGTTLAGIVGFAMIFIGLWQAYASKGIMEGHITLGSTLVVTVLTLYFSFKAGTWKKMALNTTIDSKMDQLEGIVIKDGDSGKSVSRLAPSGKAIINNEIVEVHTFGEFIDQEVEITVISVKVNKIFVTLKKSNS